MSAHVLLNLLNGLRKRDKHEALLSMLSLFRNKIHKFNSTVKQEHKYNILLIIIMTLKLFEIAFWWLKVNILLH